MEKELRVRARAARADIARGALRGAVLLELLRSVPFRDRDDWCDELLGIDGPPPDVPDLPRGAVPYLPCGVDEIVAAVLEVPLRTDDLLVDLGSGVGRVVILAHLLSGARACGIEIQAPLTERARSRADALGLAEVSFVHANAASAPLEGTVFFLYAPCNGEMLAAVLRRLHAVAQRHAIVVCAVGLEFRDVPWLQPRRTSHVSLAIYDSIVGGVSPSTTR